MKILFKFLFVLVVLVGVIYIFNDKIPTNIREKMPFINEVTSVIDSVVDTDEISSPEPKKTIESKLLVNSNADSNLAMISVNKDGIGVGVYTRNTPKGEVVDYFAIETQEDSAVSVSLDDEGVVKELKTDGYTLTYSNYTGSTIDLTVTHPNGKTETAKEIPIGQPKFSWIPISHASSAKISTIRTRKTSNREDHLDGKYYTDTVGTAWNGLICAGGLLTEIIPNPVSTAAAVIGCGTLISRVTPATVVVDGCADKSIFDCVTGMITGGGNEVSYLHGTISSSDGEHLLPDVEMIITHKNGESMRTVSELYGVYGSDGIPLDLNGTYTIKASKDEFAPRTFTMVVSDSKVKIVDSDGSVLYDEKKSPGDMPPFDFELTLNSKYKATFSTNDSLNKADGYYADLTGSIIITVDDGVFSCEWSASGNINYSDSDPGMHGPVNAKSTSCSGEVEDNKLTLTGYINGDEPYPDGFDESIVDTEEYSYVEGLIGPIENVGFRIDGEFSNDGIRGFILVPRTSFQSPVNSTKVWGIQFMATVE